MELLRLLALVVLVSGGYCQTTELPDEGGDCSDGNCCLALWASRTINLRYRPLHRFNVDECRDEEGSSCTGNPGNECGVNEASLCKAQAQCCWLRTWSLSDLFSPAPGFEDPEYTWGQYICDLSMAEFNPGNVYMTILLEGRHTQCGRGTGFERFWEIISPPSEGLNITVPNEICCDASRDGLWDPDCNPTNTPPPGITTEAPPERDCPEGECCLGIWASRTITIQYQPHHIFDLEQDCLNDPDSNCGNIVVGDTCELNDASNCRAQAQCCWLRYWADRDLYSEPPGFTGADTIGQYMCDRAVQIYNPGNVYVTLVVDGRSTHCGRGGSYRTIWESIDAPPGGSNITVPENVCCSTIGKVWDPDCNQAEQAEKIEYYHL